MKKVLGTLFGMAAAVAAVFGVAGTVAWWNAWAFLVFMAVVGGFSTRLINSVPGLAQERRTAAARAKPWDVPVVRLINLALPAMLLISALEMRFQWFPPVPAAVSLAAFAGMVPAAVFTYRAIAANSFFSSHVRIQQARGHVVVSDGPYRIVRHPGYAGSAVFNLLIPFALGFRASLAVAIGTVLLLVYRTAREDRVLLTELPGYDAYAERVPDRLIPRVW